jgi:capsular polysaccharide biosynthesis protein
MAFLAPVYTATAKLYVLSPGDSVINLSDLQIGSYLTSDYKEVFNTWEVNEQVANNLQLDYTCDQLRKMLSVENPPDTRILYITVASGDASEAMLIANEYARVAQAYISSTMSTEEPSLLSSAKVPDKPSAPNKKLNVILGFLAGAVASVGFVVVRFLFDDSIKTSDDIRTYARMTTLAIIPASESSVDDPSAAQDRNKQYRSAPLKRRA